MEIIKSLVMAFTFLGALYYSVVGFTYVIAGAIRAGNPDNTNNVINAVPAMTACVLWTIFAAEKGIFTL